MPQSNDTNDLACTPYVGGSTSDSSEAILDYLAYGDKLTKVRLLSSPKDKESGNARHGFFIAFEHMESIIVPRGYASGYGGTGPNQLSNILLVLESYDVYVGEILLEPDVFSRLRNQCLTHQDLDDIRSVSDFQANDISEYILPHHFEPSFKRYLFNRYSPKLPLAMLHPSIQDLKSRIFTNPEDALRQGYIRIETKLRDLSGSSRHGVSLFDNVLKPTNGTVKLKNIVNESEQEGLLNFIKGVFQLYQVPLMHRETPKAKYGTHSAISEFLLISHILHLCDDLRPRIKPKRKSSLQQLDEKIEKIEKQVRTLVANSKAEINPHILLKIKQRVKSSARNDPSVKDFASVNILKRLSFCDWRELEAVIVSKSNWPLFENRFHNKGNLNVRFNQIAALRNVIRHSREVDVVTLKDGEAAIQWFNNFLK